MACLIPPSITPFREFKDALPEDKGASHVEGDKPLEEAPAPKETMETSFNSAGDSSNGESSEDEP